MTILKDNVKKKRPFEIPISEFLRQIEDMSDAQLNSSSLWEPSYTETVNRDNAAGSSFAINALKSITGMPSKSEEYETGIGYEPLPEIKAPAPKSAYNVGIGKENNPEYVKKIQSALGIKTDGIYGPQTRAAVMKFQSDNNLQVDGIAGIQTLGKLFGPTMELGMESKQDAYADTKGLYNYVEPVKQTAIGDDELSLPPNLRKVYEDELRPDISQSVADKKFYQAKPTTNPRAKFRPATIEKRDAYYDDERQKAYEEAVEIARQKGYIDENGNYVGPEDKLKDVILGQAALSWTARAKDAEIGREIMGGKKADTEKYDQRIMDNPQWMVQNPEYVKPYDPDEFLTNPKLALKKTLRDAVDVLSLRLQMLPSGLEWAAKGAGIGAGSALALGQAGPQALSPEEAFTVPAGAVLGAGAGYKIGTGKYMAEMEAGQAYKEYIEDGMDENIARVMAIGAGTTNAWLEEVLGTKLGQIPGFSSFINNAFAKGFVNFLKEAGGEMAEEGAQAAATKTFMEIGKVVDSVINKKPIEGTLLDKESVDGIVSGIVQLGARESVQSAPGLIGSMVIGGAGGATTNAARSAIQNVVANKTNSVKSIIEVNPVSAINIDDLKNTNLPSDFVWALKQIKLGVPLPNEVTQKYPELIPAINGELSVEEIVNSVDSTQQVQPPLETVTEQEKPTDLNAPTAIKTDTAIENIDNQGIIQPEPNIEATEEIITKQVETGAEKVENEDLRYKYASKTGTFKKKEKDSESMGKFVTLKNFGEVEIVDDTDKSMIKIKNKQGTIIPLGKNAFDNLLIDAADTNKYTEEKRKDAVSDEENRIRKEITMNGTAYNNDMSKRVKVQFERTGEIHDSMGRLEPVGKYYIEVTADGKLQDVGTTRYDTIEEAQEAAVKVLLNTNKVEGKLKRQETQVIIGEAEKIGIPDNLNVILNEYRHKILQGAKQAGKDVNLVIKFANTIEDKITDEMLKAHNIKEGSEAYIAGKTEIKKSGRVYDVTITLLATKDQPLTQEMMHELVGEVRTSLWEAGDNQDYNKAIKWLTDKGVPKDEAGEMLTEIITDAVINDRLGGDVTSDRVAKVFFKRLTDAVKKWISEFLNRISFFRRAIWHDLPENVKAQVKAVQKGDWISAFKDVPDNVGYNKYKYSIKAQKATPWGDNFPKGIGHTTIGFLKSEKNGNAELHKKAKAGDEIAATQLVEKCIKKDRILQLAKQYPDAIIVPAIAEERTGINMLPKMYADRICEIGGFKQNDNIYQINRTFHTGAGAMDRIISKPIFDGEVKKGYNYIIVDDVVTQGGTLNSLRQYIEENGGNVVAVSALAFDKGSTEIAINDNVISQLINKFGRDNFEQFLREEGIAWGIEELTNSEGLYFLKFRDVDSIRDRANEAKSQRRLRESARIQKTARLDLESLEQGDFSIKSTENDPILDRYKKYFGDTFKSEGVKPNETNAQRGEYTGNVTGINRRVALQDVKEQTELYRYYLTQRPPGPGTIPKNAANVVSFDKKTYVPEIGREAWGYAEYYDFLAPPRIEGYELIEHPYNDELYKKEIDESEGKPEPTIEQSTEKSKAETPAEQREEFAEEVAEIEKLTNEQIEKGLSPIVSEIRMLRDKIKNEKLKGSKRHDIESRIYELTKRQKVLDGMLSRTIDNPRTNAEKLQNALIEKQLTLDNIEITNPKAKKHGFDIKQRMQIAEELIEGNKTNKHKITIDVDRDGTLNILNNEPVIADVLNELGVKKTEVKIPYGLDKNAGNKVAIDKNNMLAITNGAYAATVTEEEIGALKEFANLNKIDYSDDFDLSRTIIKKDHLKELKETPKVYNANKINYYVFKVEDIFYMFDKKYFDVFNKDGNRFYVSDNNKEAAMIYGNDDEFVGILLPSMKRAGNISKETYDNLNPATGKEFFSKPKANKKVQSSAIIEPLTGNKPQLPQGDESSSLKDTKTVDEIVEIIEKTIDVPIRTGKFRQRAHGIFKTVPEVIRTKVTNDLPTICHEVGHYLDKKFELDDKQFRAELMTLGALASKPSYTPKEVRAEGIAEFVRLYLTDTKEAQNKAPGFYQHFETKLDRDSLVMLNSIRTDILKVVNLSDVDKVINDISIGEKRKTTKQDKSFTGMLQRAYNAWLDEYAPFSAVQKRAKEAGYTGKNVDTAVKLYRGIESKVLNNLEMKQTDLNDNVIGKSYNEIMKPIKKNELSNFRAYMVARRAIDYESRGMVLPQSYAVYFNTLKALEQKHSHFAEVFDDIRTWEDNELQLLVDSGVMSQATVDRIKELNPNHIPLYRIQEAVEIVYGGAGSTLGQSKKVVKRAKGSGKTIIDPLESLVTNAFIIRRAAEANEIIGMLHDMAGTIDGFGDLVEIVPPGIKGFTFNVEEIGKVLQRLLEDNLQADIDERQKKNPNDPMIQILELQKQQIDVKSMDLDKLVTLFRANYKEKDGEVTYYKNGKPVLMQVYPELYKAIKGLNRQASHFLIRMLNVPKRVIQAGAVTTVRFAVWNMSRDTLGSIIQSEAGINPIDILMGYKSALKKDQWYQDWVLSGGATDFLMSSDRAKAQDILYDHVLGYTLIDKLKEALEKPTKENLSRLLFHPINSIRDTVEWSEAGPKVAEFKKLQINKGLTQEEAAKLSREVNQDFLKYGYKGKELNKITGFFNANLQGNVRIGETFAKHPYRTLLRGLLYITLPSLFLYYWNDDNKNYRQLASWRKALFYNVPLGNRKTAQYFLPIPRAYGYGLVFGAIPEILLDKLKYDDPKSWENLKEAFMINFDIPLMPSAFSPLWEVRGNKSWNKVPIESVGDKSKPAYLRYNERSSVAAKGIANILKDVPGANKLSPKQIDYLTKGYTGSVGDFFWRIPDTVKNIATNPSDYANYPVVRSFIVDVAYSNSTIDDFYTYGEELNMRLKEAKETGTYRATSHLPEDIQLALVPAIKNATKEYNSVAKGFSDARKAIKEIKANDKFTPAEKKLREREIQFKMIDMADKFNKKYNRFKKENKIK